MSGGNLNTRVSSPERAEDSIEKKTATALVEEVRNFVESRLALNNQRELDQFLRQIELPVDTNGWNELIKKAKLGDSKTIEEANKKAEAFKVYKETNSRDDLDNYYKGLERLLKESKDALWQKFERDLIQFSPNTNQNANTETEDKKQERAIKVLDFLKNIFSTKNNNERQVNPTNSNEGNGNDEINDLDRINTLITLGCDNLLKTGREIRNLKKEIAKNSSDPELKNQLKTKQLEREKFVYELNKFSIQKEVLKLKDDITEVSDELGQQSGTNILARQNLGNKLNDLNCKKVYLEQASGLNERTYEIAKRIINEELSQAEKDSLKAEKDNLLNQSNELILKSVGNQGTNHTAPTAPIAQTTPTTPVTPTTPTAPVTPTTPTAPVTPTTPVTPTIGQANSTETVHASPTDTAHSNSTGTAQANPGETVPEVDGSHIHTEHNPEGDQSHHHTHGHVEHNSEGGQSNHQDHSNGDHDHGHGHKTPWTMKVLKGINGMISGVLGTIGFPHGKVNEILSKLPWMESAEFNQVGRYLLEDHMNHSLVEAKISAPGQTPVLKHSVKKSTNIEIEYEGKEKKVIKEVIDFFPLNERTPLVFDFCELEVEGKDGKIGDNTIKEIRHDVKVKGKIWVRVHDVVGFHEKANGNKGLFGEILQEERGKLTKAVQAIINENNIPQIPSDEKIKQALYGESDIKYKNYLDEHGHVIFSYAIGFSDVDWTDETKKQMNKHEEISNVVFLADGIGKNTNIPEALKLKIVEAWGLSNVSDKHVELKKQTS